MIHHRLDEALVVTGSADAPSDSLDLLSKTALDNITLWLTDTAGIGGTYTIQQSEDGDTWTDYTALTIEAGDTEGKPMRPPYAQYVRVGEGAADVTLSVGT